MPINTSLPDIENVTSEIENNNIVLNYTTTVEPDVKALEDNIMKELNIKNVIVSYTIIEGFATMKYNVIITFIPNENTNIADLSKTINNNIDKLITVPKKKSYLIHIIIFIILLAALFGWLYFKRK